MRKLVPLLSSVLLLSLLGGSAWGQVQYTLTDLGSLSGGSGSYATGINNSGQVVGIGVMG